MGRVQEVIRRAAVVLVVISAPLAVVACGGGDDAGARAAPPGSKPVKTADFSVAVPAGWQVERTGFIEVRPSGTDANRAQLRVGSKREYGGDINGASRLHVAEISTRNPGARETTSEAIDVPGAADARRIEFTAPRSGPLAAGRIVTVLALSEDRTLVNLTIGVTDGDAAAARIDEILGSLEVSS